jgi:ribosome-binding protein aMBF1 (putative translation factor)
MTLHNKQHAINTEKAINEIKALRKRYDAMIRKIETERDISESEICRKYKVYPDTIDKIINGK